MERATYPMNLLANKPCLICGADAQVPALYKDSTPAICSECYNAIVWAKEKVKRQKQIEGLVDSKNGGECDGP